MYFKTWYSPKGKKENGKMYVKKGAGYEEQEKQVYWK